MDAWGSSLRVGWELFGIRSFERQEEVRGMSCCCVFYVELRKASPPVPPGRTVTSTLIRRTWLKPTRGCVRRTGKCDPKFSSSGKGWPKHEREIQTKINETFWRVTSFWTVFWTLDQGWAIKMGPKMQVL